MDPMAGIHIGVTATHGSTGAAAVATAKEQLVAEKLVSPSEAKSLTVQTNPSKFMQSLRNIFSALSQLCERIRLAFSQAPKPQSAVSNEKLARMGMVAPNDPSQKLATRIFTEARTRVLHGRNFETIGDLKNVIEQIRRNIDSGKYPQLNQRTGTLLLNLVRREMYKVMRQVDLITDETEIKKQRDMQRDILATLEQILPEQAVDDSEVSIGGSVYEKSDVLGEGTFGSVVAAEHRVSESYEQRRLKILQGRAPLKPGTPVAIKLSHSLSRTDTVEDMYKKRHEGERAVECMRALEDCPFAVHVSDVRTNVVTGESRTVMTRAAGDLGHDAITDPKELAGLGYQMATALQTLHERTGYCHNDIKPANMLRSSDKKRVLLADFGSANDATIKSFVGSTLSFIAPEVLKAPHFEKNDSNRFKSDVFSLGMTLFSMALPEPESESESEPKPKRLPFVRLGDVITYNEERWKSLRDQIKLPDGELKDIIFQMLHPNPDKRPSMAEVRDALAPIVDKPAVAPPAVDEDEEYLEGVMRGIDDINN